MCTRTAARSTPFGSGREPKTRGSQVDRVAQLHSRNNKKHGEHRLIPTLSTCAEPDRIVHQGALEQKHLIGQCFLDGLETPKSH